MNHVVIGSLVPFLIGLAVYVYRGRRMSFGGLVLFPMLMTIGGIWAIAPDIPRMLGMQELYMDLSQDPRCDLFFWHYSIDLVETDSPLWSLVYVCVIATILLAVWREIHLEEKR